jgi:hypothetical protein
MTTRFTKALLVASLAAAAAAPAVTAHASIDPVSTCRQALAPSLKGVCFWSDEGFQGQLTAHPNPKPPSVCGNIDPAGSMVNLTSDKRVVYAYQGCISGNELAEVLPDGAVDDLGDVPGGSWR